MFFEKSDDQLMEEVKKGSQKAFQEILKRHGAAVFGMTMRMFAGNRALAEDVTQEVWVRMLEKCGLYQPQGHFRAWLMTIARNQALGEMRKNARFTDVEEGVEDLVEEKFDVEEFMGTEEQKSRIQRQMDALPAPQRAALVLWLGGDLSYEEIAEELKLNLGGVKTLIFRAKAFLRKAMEEK